MEENQVLQTVLDTMYARRSIRAYAPDMPVGREQTEILLRAAMAAPSACNLQPWEFVVVDTAEGMAQMKPLVPGGQFNAPMAIVVCARTEYIPWGGNGWQIDCALAMENMMLAACAMGLGSLCIGDFKGAEVRALLNIPQGVEIVNIVYFGYPAEQKRPVTRYKEIAVHWERYDTQRPHPARTTQGMIRESIEDS